MRRLLNFIEHYSPRFLWLMIIFYSLFFSAVSIWKYDHLLYNGLDLAIINNVFYNTLHGHWFWSSIQGHAYLGDHFTPILIFLLPFYILWPSPEFLLILQTLFLALAAWPLYKIAQLILKDNRLALGTALLWLINPLVHNANLFEFHFIALLPFLSFALFYYYLRLKAHPAKRTFLFFFVLMLLCLVLREDVAFIILIFLFLAWLENSGEQRARWFLGVGFLFTLIYLLIAFSVISHFSNQGFSPFTYYYNWIFSSTWWSLFRHIFSAGNFKMLLGFLLPLLFIPLAKPKWLLISLVPLVQLILSAAGGSPLVWKLHYSLFFLPAIFFAFIYGFKKINRLVGFHLQNRWLLLIILLTSSFYLWSGFGPLTLHLNQLVLKPAKGELLATIPSSASVLSSYEFLPDLSNRYFVYALNYYFLGHQQFGNRPYVMLRQPDYVLINFHDLIGFQLQFSQSSWAKKYYSSGASRLRHLLKNYGAIKIVGDAILFKKNHPPRFNLYKLTNYDSLPSADKKLSYGFNNQIRINRFKLSFSNYRQAHLSLNLYVSRPPKAGYQLKVNLSDGHHHYYKYLPLAYGVYPSGNWQSGDLVKLNYWFDLPEESGFKKIIQADLSLVKLEGVLSLNKLGVVKLKVTQEQKIGRTVSFKIN